MENQNNELSQEEILFCEHCIYFTAHYVKHHNTFIPSVFGHCSFPRLKIKKSHHQACPEFKRKSIAI